MPIPTDDDLRPLATGGEVDPEAVQRKLVKWRGTIVTAAGILAAAVSTYQFAIAKAHDLAHQVAQEHSQAGDKATKAVLTISVEELEAIRHRLLVLEQAAQQQQQATEDDSRRRKSLRPIRRATAALPPVLVVPAHPRPLPTDLVQAERLADRITQRPAAPVVVPLRDAGPAGP